MTHYNDPSWKNDIKPCEVCGRDVAVFDNEAPVHATCKQPVAPAPTASAREWLTDNFYFGDDEIPTLIARRSFKWNLEVSLDEVLEAYASSQSSKLEGKGWLPISEAPKTGEHILVLDRSGFGWGVCGGKRQWPTAVVHWWNAPGEQGWYLSLGGDQEFPNPTHFQLFEAPTAAVHYPCGCSASEGSPGYCPTHGEDDRSIADVWREKLEGVGQEAAEKLRARYLESIAAGVKHPGPDWLEVVAKGIIGELIAGRLKP